MHMAEAAYDALTDLGYEVVVMSDQERVVTRTVTVETDPLGSLMDELDPEMAEHAYRRLSTVLHPDAGGSNELMQRLNAANEKSRRRSA